MQTDFSTGRKPDVRWRRTMVDHENLGVADLDWRWNVSS